MRHFTVYTKKDCPFCHKALDLLMEKAEAAGITNIEIRPLTEERRAFLKEHGLNTVPQIWTTDGNGPSQHIGGFTDLEKWFVVQG